MTFIWPWMLFSLGVTPMLIGFYVYLLGRREHVQANLGPLGMVQDSSGYRIGHQRHIPVFCSIFGITILLFGLARPEMPISVPRMQGTVILAFDVSNSMFAEDFEPTRMEAAKTAARSFVEDQPDTILIGVVAFSNGGLVVQPPTNEQAAILAAIDRLEPQGATSLGQGIFTSLNAIAGEALLIDLETLEEGSPPIDISLSTSSVIVMLTDGENTSELDPLQIADLAAQAGVRIYPIGIGSPDGIILEVDGFNVLTQLNEPVLQDIASLTNGEYYAAEDAESLQEIYQAIDLQLTTRGEKMEITALLAGLSLLFFLLGGVLSLIWFGRVPV